MSVPPANRTWWWKIHVDDRLARHGTDDGAGIPVLDRIVRQELPEAIFIAPHEPRRVTITITEVN